MEVQHVKRFIMLERVKDFVKEDSQELGPDEQSTKEHSTRIISAKRSGKYKNG